MNEYLDYIKKGKKFDLIIRKPDGALRFFSRFEYIDENQIIILRPQNKEVPFNYPQGQFVELHVYTSGGIFKLQCRLLSANERECILTKPISVDRMQRREYIRVNMKIKMLLKLYLSGTHKVVETHTNNLSAKGANIYLSEDIKKYSKIEASLMFDEGSITTLADVVKVKPLNVNSQIVYDTSLMFITVSEKEIDFIVKKCFEYQTQERKKQLSKDVE